MIEPREVSEHEATEPRASTRTVKFAPAKRRDLAWRLQVVSLGSYLIMWRVWNAVALLPWRNLRLWASACLREPRPGEAHRDGYTDTSEKRPSSS